MKMYVPLEGNRSNIAQTAWVLIALIHSGQVFFCLSKIIQSFPNVYSFPYPN